MVPNRFDRVIDVAGDGFLLGTAAGSSFHFVKGLAVSPVGGGGRLAGAVRAVHANAPCVAGMCGAYAAVYCASKSAVSIAHQRDDPWNAVAGGAMSGGLLNARRGASAAALSAALGATTVAAVLGLVWAIRDRHGRDISEREARMYLDAPRSELDAPKPRIIPVRSTVLGFPQVPPSSTSGKGERVLLLYW
ncbi:hypothetical protein QOZ80_8AG0631180 [Eleusine coracana subsp. coracana]|nr:hypothetical protein QOZ80_8AG0631180 [Eleusine coracana subsp. coracana]